jgi:uncharacterized glyoxalase superfamily protein PhnB
MSETTTTTASTQRIYPALRYRDARAAIAFLHDAFGFEPVAIYPEEGEPVVHAVLAFEGECIMLGTERDVPETLPGIVTVAAAGGVTSTQYVALDDPDAHYEHAKAAGATILREPVTTDYGSREYTARDPAGNIWTFGTYRPQTFTP